MDLSGAPGLAVSIDVGARLRELREKRRLSTRELATLSGITPNALNLIERGISSPSINTLSRLAAALNIPITAFFRQELSPQEIVFRKAGNRPRLPFLRGLWEDLGGDSFSGRMETFQLTLESGCSSWPNGLVHSGHEFVLCLQGEIEYEVNGQDYLMQPGDSLLFLATLLHRWRNPGPYVARAIIVISSYEDFEQPGDLHLAQTDDRPGGERGALAP